MKHAASRRLLIWLVKWLHYVSNRQRQIISGQLRLTYPHPGVGEMSMSLAACLTDWVAGWLAGWIWLILSLPLSFFVLWLVFCKMEWCLEYMWGSQRICSWKKKEIAHAPGMHLCVCVRFIIGSEIIKLKNGIYQSKWKCVRKKTNKYNASVCSHLPNLCIISSVIWLLIERKI